LAIKYPLSVEYLPSPDTPILKATATIIFPSTKAKAFVSFLLDLHTFASWPMSISSLKTEVKIAYGRIQEEAILDAVVSRLAQATPSDNHCCLLDACIEATEQYD